MAWVYFTFVTFKEKLVLEVVAMDNYLGHAGTRVVDLLVHSFLVSFWTRRTCGHG